MVHRAVSATQLDARRRRRRRPSRPDRRWKHERAASRSSVCGGRRHGGRITRAKLVLRGRISEISISVEYFVREDCDIPEISESMTNLFRNFREDLEIPEISVGSEI